MLSKLTITTTMIFHCMLMKRMQCKPTTMRHRACKPQA